MAHPKKHAKWKKPGIKEHIMFDSNCMKFQRKANIKRQKISEIIDRLGLWAHFFYGDGNAVNLDYCKDCTTLSIY